MRHNLKSTLTRSLLALSLLAVYAPPAAAQMEGRVMVGVGVSSTFPSSSDLESGLSIGYSIGTVPKEGWGLAWAFNWYGADVKGEAVGTQGKFGRLSVRPIMIGVGYTHAAGRFTVSPNVVLGPALNTLRIDSAQRPSFALEGDDFDRKGGTWSLAVRPAVTVNYALTSRFGLSGTAGYVFNKSTFDLGTPAGSLEKEFDSNAFNVRAGVILSLF